MGLSGDNIVNILVDSLSVEDLEAALRRKKGIHNVTPRPMSKKELLLEKYRKRMVALGILHPPKRI